MVRRFHFRVGWGEHDNKGLGSARVGTMILCVGFGGLMAYGLLGFREHGLRIYKDLGGFRVVGFRALVLGRTVSP